MSSHFSGLLNTENVADGRCYVSQYTALNLGILMIVAHINERYGVERVGSVSCAVGVDGIVSVAVICNDNNLIIIAQGSFYGLIDADVDSCYRLLDGVVHAGMTNHIAIGVIENDAVVFL